MAELDLDNLVLNDITVDEITNSDKTGVFDKLMESVNDNINAQYLEGRITSGDYANVYLGSLQTVLQQSIQFILQEQISEAQISAIFKDNLLKQEQIESEALNNATDGLIENQILKIKEDVLVAKEQVSIAKTQTATEQANSIGNIDKVLGYSYTLDGDGNIVVGATTGDGKLDYEKDLMKEQTESEALHNDVDGTIVNQILKIKADVEVAQEQVEIAKTQTATELANSIANIDKVLGYDYTLDGDGNIIVGVDTGDGKLDFETALMEEQAKVTYTERVLKDKQAAKLGLDNTMKLSEASRESDANFKYIPNYTDPGA